MKTSYEVKVEHEDHTLEVLQLLEVREEGPWGDGRQPESVALLCRAPMTRDKPIDMILFCPACGMQHIDAPESENTYSGRLHESSWWELGGNKPERWTNPPHRSHLCANCGHQWRPADVATNGVAEIKTRGKNDSPPPAPIERGAPMSLEESRRALRVAEMRAVLGGLVLNSDGLPRLYSVSFRPEGGFLVEPVVPSAPDAPIVERKPQTPDTEIEMDRRQAERAHAFSAAARGWAEACTQLRGTVEREPAWREPGSGGLVAISWQWRDALLARLRGVLAFPGSGSAVGVIANVAVVREAISFLESLAP